jgi:hypothetical protein
MFDGKYNHLLDSSGFRFGTLALAFVIWTGTVIGLLAAA